MINSQFSNPTANVMMGADWYVYDYYMEEVTVEDEKIF